MPFCLKSCAQHATNDVASTNTSQQPHGIDYALILQDEHGHRIFGFDNAHAFDNAQAEDCWDHEHKVGRVGQRFRYDFVSGSQLITDFFEMLNSYCTLHGVTANFISDDEHE